MPTNKIDKIEKIDGETNLLKSLPPFFFLSNAQWLDQLLNQLLKFINMNSIELRQIQIKYIHLKHLFLNWSFKKLAFSPLPKFSPLPLAVQLSPRAGADAGDAARDAGDAGVQQEHPEQWS